MCDVENPDDPEPVEDHRNGGEAHVVQLEDEEKLNGDTQNGKESCSSEEEQEARRKVIISWQCLNPECTVSRRDQLVTASSYVLRSEEEETK